MVVLPLLIISESDTVTMQRMACLLFTCVLISPCISASLPAQVLDELGRGTATHDGHAIAYGVALHLAQTKRCRCAQ